MSVTIDITIAEDIESGDDEVPESTSLSRWAQAAYQHTTPAVASVLVTSNSEMQQLNKQYRGKDKVTNVLSFPMQSPDGVDLCLLGDVVLCAPVINQEARQQGKTGEAHWAHMLVHGMLHLQGYDHVADEDAEIMEQQEIAILRRLGFSNPYETLPVTDQ
jgi:probable rRNA maturation factor